MHILGFLIIGLIAGWLAGKIMSGGGYGLVGDLVVGVVGAFIGGFLFDSMGVAQGRGVIGSLIVAVIGAIILLFIVRLIKRSP